MNKSNNAIQVQYRISVRTSTVLVLCAVRILYKYTVQFKPVHVRVIYSYIARVYSVQHVQYWSTGKYVLQCAVKEDCIVSCA